MISGIHLPGKLSFFSPKRLTTMAEAARMPPQMKKNV
jgi:hypothetical protein